MRPCSFESPRPYHSTGQRGAAQRASTTLATQARYAATSSPAGGPRTPPFQFSASHAATSARSFSSVTGATCAASSMALGSQGFEVAFAVGGRRAEQLGVSARAAEVKVGRMRPGKGDAAVHLDGVRGGLGEGVGAGEGRERDRFLGVGRAVGQLLRGVAGGGDGRLALEQQ